MEKRPNESVTEFTMRRIRAEIIEECAALADRWANDAAEFDASDRCRIQHNVCRNMAIALRNLKDRTPITSGMGK